MEICELVDENTVIPIMPFVSFSVTGHVDMHRKGKPFTFITILCSKCNAASLPSEATAVLSAGLLG